MPDGDTASRRRLLWYIADVRAALRMDNWDVILHPEPCEEGNRAETWHQENHSVLNIQVAANLLDSTPDEIRNTIVHELVHAQHRDVWAAFSSLAESDYVPAVLGRTQDQLFTVHMERFVSWVADRIEGSVPKWDPRRPIPTKLPKGCSLHERES